MEPIDVAQRYFDAWNRRDPTAVVATFAPGGTYSDPVAGRITGQAIAEYTRELFVAFPDLSFEIVSAAPAGDRMVAAQWLMRGTNSGPFRGGPPTGKSVVVPGADFIVVEGEKIRSVQGYFDSRSLPVQLGLQVIVQPRSVGPVSFGVSVSMHSGKHTKPGAFSITAIQVRSEEEADEVRDRSRKIMGELVKMPGFISFLGASVGQRLYTITAWEDAESPGQLLQGGVHREAMSRFFGPQFAAGGITSVWVPERINVMWVRCTACGSMSDYGKLQGKCQCGQALPGPIPYW